MDFLKKYERHLSSLAFILGFAFDYHFTPRVDNPYTPILLGGYLALGATTILLEQFFWRMTVRRPSLRRFRTILPVATQIAFGVMMSLLFVYYSRSATIAGSWPFMVLLGGMFVGNELFRDHVRLFKFQLASFFFALYLTMVLCVPIVLHELGTAPFLIAGAVSLVVTLFFVGAVSFISQKIVREHIVGILGLIGGIYVLITALYFTHLIPPIPLLLRESGVFHSISRDANGNYVGSSEEFSWEEQLGLREKVVHLSAGEALYFYSAVFAPIAIETPVVHEWQYQDANTGQWSTVYRISFPIVGGRDGGYREYSTKENVAPGNWRVSVTTASGELLGRDSFSVMSTDTPTPLEETVLD